MGSPDKCSAEMSNLHEGDGSTVVGKLDLNLAFSKEGSEGYGHENEAWGNKAEVDLNQQEHHGTSLLHAGIGRERSETPYKKSISQAHYDLDDDNGRAEEFDSDRERSHSYIGETEVADGRYSDKSSSPVEAASFHTKSEFGDPDRSSLKFPSRVDSSYQPEDMEENSPRHKVLMETSGTFPGNLQYEKTESEYDVVGQGGTELLMGNAYGGNELEKEDNYYSGKLLSNNRELEERNYDGHAPGRTPGRSASPVRETFVSPARASDIQQVAERKLTSSLQGFQASPYSARESRQKISPSPEKTGGGSRRVLSEDHSSLPARRTSPSPSRRSRSDSPRRDDSLQKRLSSSPRRHQLSPDRRRPDRSVSRSPTRQRDSSYGYRRDHRDRSRSRSPYARDRYRRSPRRYSPRHRSPSGYHSRRRSPRRRPWSPPRNRNNGVGRPGNNLFVAGFSFVTTERDLERKFSRFGRVRDVRIVRDKRSGDSRGFGFLSLERDEDADAAIRALDQTEWNGRVVLVEKSKTR